MAVSILYLSFYNHKTITEQTLKFRVPAHPRRNGKLSWICLAFIYMLVH